MARKALVEILGDATSFARSLKESVHAADQFSNKLKEVSVDAKKSAEVQVQASVKKDARLRQEITAYKAVAAAAAKGSREQVAAANLAAQGQARLARSMAVTAHESHALSSASKTVERDFERLGRGAAFGSGAFHGLGRSVLYASSFLIGGASLTEGLKTSIEAATQSRATMGQLATAVRNAGVSYRDYRAQIEETLRSSGRLGFTQRDSAASFTTLIRATHDAAKARRDLTLAEDINRGTSGRVSLAAATKAVAQAEAGRTGGLTRLGIAIQKGVTSQEALRQATVLYGGAAVKWSKSAAGEQARLSVAIEETKVKIGTALLPTITALTTKLADWLDKSKNQARIQRDVKEAVHDVGVAVHVLVEAFRIGAPIVRGVTTAFGGLANTLKLAAIGFGAFKFAKMLDGLGGVGLKSKIAAGEVSTLRGKLLALGALPEITVAIELVIHRKGIQSWLSSHGLGFLHADKGLLDLLGLKGGGNSSPIKVPAGPTGPLIATPAGPTGPLTSATTAAAATASPSLTAAQKLALALTDNPNDMAALRRQATNDRNGIAFLTRRFKQGKIDRDVYFQLVKADKQDLQQTLQQIQSLEDAAAQKAQASADKQKAAREKAAKAAKAAIQAGQFEALGLGRSGQGQSPLKETLGKELARVKAQLKGTLLDTDKNSHLLAQVGKVLDGQFGALTDKTRKAVRHLLDTLDNELKKKKSGFGPLGRVVSAESLTKGIGFASTAARIEQETRIAQALAHGGRVPTAMSLQGQPVVVHTKVHLDGREVGRSVTTHQQKSGWYRATQTSGINAGRGWGG